MKKRTVQTTVSHPTKNEMVKITVVPYLADTVNYVTMDETAKINDTIFIWHTQWIPSTIYVWIERCSQCCYYMANI